MTWWWRIDAAVNRITKWGLYSSVFALIVIMLLATTDIITTKFFNYPIRGTTEIIEDLHIILALMGMAFVQLNRGHIAGPIFQNVFPKSINKDIDLASNVVGLLVCSLISWRALPLFQTMFLSKETKSEWAPYLLWPFVLILFLAFTLLAIAFILSFIRVIAEPKK